MKLFLFGMYFLSPELFAGNRQQSNARAGQKKNHMFFFGNARLKSNARAQQIKKP